MSPPRFRDAVSKAFRRPISTATGCEPTRAPSAVAPALSTMAMALVTSVQSPGEAGSEEFQAAKVDRKVQSRSSRVGCLYAVTAVQPTMNDMLIFRTMNQLLKAPGHNADHLASKLRDELMPHRSWWLKHVPWAKYQLRHVLENNRWGAPGCTNFIDARTKWFDGVVLAALGAGIKQVVIVAAGYDTRAYRLAPRGGSVRFFEVDLPDASHRKAALVCKLRLVPEGVAPPVYVAADLSQTTLDAALRGTSFDPSQPALFTLEGLIYYLPENAALALLANITVLSAPGSRAAFDFMHAAALEGHDVSEAGYKYAGFKVTAKAVANKGEAYKFGLRDTPEAVAGFLAAASRAASRAATQVSSPPSPAGTKGQGILRLTQYLGPKEMVAAQLPHLSWDDKRPPVAAFYSYAACEKCIAA